MQEYQNNISIFSVSSFIFRNLSKSFGWRVYSVLYKIVKNKYLYFINIFFLLLIFFHHIFIVILLRCVVKNEDTFACHQKTTELSKWSFNSRMVENFGSNITYRFSRISTRAYMFVYIYMSAMIHWHIECISRVYVQNESRGWQARYTYIVRYYAPRRFR